MKSHLFPLILTGVLGLALSCSSAPGDAPSQASEKGIKVAELLPNVVNGKLVATVSLSSTHSVEFWQFSDGAINLREIGAAQEYEGKIDYSALQPLSPVERFTRLAGPKVPVPEALLEAAQQAPSQPAGPLAPPPLEQKPEQGPVGSGLTTLIDWNADAAWFAQNFCSWSGVSSVWCPTNVGWADAGTVYATYYDSTCFSASENQNASYTTKYWNGYTWVTNTSNTVPPRTWYRWIYNSSNYYSAHCESIYTGGDSRVDFSHRFTWGAPVCIGPPPSDLQSACCYVPIRDAVPADNDLDGVFDACEDAVASKFAPIVYHSSDESNFPANVDWFLPKTSLYFYDDGCTPDWYAFAQSAPSQSSLLSWYVTGGCGSGDTVYSNGTRSNQKQRTFFLADVAQGYRVGSLNPQDWRTYVHAYRNNLSGITIQYWRMYAYNDAFNNHGGDWEGEFVILDSNLNPYRIGLMGHTSIDELSTNSFTWEGNHPRVFSEGGGHATHENGNGIYAVGCPYFPCHIDPAIQATFVRQETWNWGIVTWTNGYTYWNGGLLNVGEKVHPLNGQVFIQYSGIWGSPGTFYGTSGYWGPAYNETGMSGTFMTAWCYGRVNAAAGECYPAATSR